MRLEDPSQCMAILQPQTWDNLEMDTPIDESRPFACLILDIIAHRSRPQLLKMLAAAHSFHAQ